MSSFSYKAIVVAYSFLIGSIPFGLIISLFKGVNIRKEGSGNVGATNVWRCVGPMEGISTAILDGCKGVLAVLITNFVHPNLIPMAMFAAVAGHMFSPFLIFKGGKGVATLAVTMLFIDTTRGIVFLEIWLATILLTRYVSLGSILGMCYIICSASYQILVTPIDSVQGSIALSEICAAFLSIIMHSPNIGRLIQMKENKISLKKDAKPKPVKRNKRKL